MSIFFIPTSFIRDHIDLIKKNNFKNLLVSFGRLDTITTFQTLAKAGCLIHVNNPIYDEDVLRIKNKFLKQNNSKNKIDKERKMVVNGTCI